jgi:hypothetical protein
MEVREMKNRSKPSDTVFFAEKTREDIYKAIENEAVLSESMRLP